ncbi:MAG: sugar phosphate isomerase/epimerase family protein [Planctomycetales bacterium]
MFANRLPQFSPAPQSKHTQPASPAPLLLEKRWGVHQTTTLRWSFKEDLLAFRDMGIGQVGVWRQKLDDVGLEKARELLRETGIKAGSLSWAGGFTGTLGLSFDEAVADVKSALRMAHALEASSLVVMTGGKGKLTPNHVRKVALEGLNKAGELAEILGVDLLVQPMHSRFNLDWSFLSDMEKCLDLMERLNHPSVGIALDIFALGHHPRFLDLLPQLMPFIRLVFLSDSGRKPRTDYDRRPLGQGTLPIMETVAILEASGYQGRYEVQLMSEKSWGEDYQILLQEARRYMTQLERKPSTARSAARSH